MNPDQLREVGKPTLFNIDTFLDVVEQLICSDEVEKALHMLDNGAPAYYEAYPTERMLEIRRSLHRQLWTPVQYAGIYDELKFDPEKVAWPLRCQILEAEVKKANDQEKLPQIIELAPGGLFIKEALKLKNLKCLYSSIGLDKSVRFTTDLKPLIFIAFELIEHLSNPWEIYQNYLKFGQDADIVMLSTPLFTWGGGMGDWRDRPLGHLRCYSPKSFHDIAAKMFQGYQWEMVTGDGTMVLKGVK